MRVRIWGIHYKRRGQSTPIMNSPLHSKALAIAHMFGGGFWWDLILSRWHKAYGGRFTKCIMMLLKRFQTPFYFSQLYGETEKFPEVDKCSANQGMTAIWEHKEEKHPPLYITRTARANFHQLKKSKMMFPPFPACRSPAGSLNVISSIPTTSPHYWVNRFGHVLSKQSQDWQLREWGESEAASFPIRVASGKTLKRRSILQIAKLILSQAGDI